MDNSNLDSKKAMVWRSERIHKLFIDNLGKLFVLLVIIAIAVFIVDKNIPLISVLIFISFIFALGFAVERFHRKVAYELLLSPNSSKLIFKMYRTNRVVTFHFDDIQKILINGYLIFIFNEGRVVFGGKVDTPLIKELSGIKKINWGFWCFLLGPSGKYREGN